MNRLISKNKFGFIAGILTLVMVSGSTVLALPSGANAHAQGVAAGNTTATVTTGNGHGNGQSQLTGGKLKACQNRQVAIKNIMTRIDTRAQNQLNLFNTIATRVESFYVKKGKTLSNYDQLVAAVQSASVQTSTDFGTLKSNSTFTCSIGSPKGMVTVFQGYLKTEISDLKNLRTAVKNLIVGVASANGVTISNSAQSGSTGSQTTRGTN
jgi:hypothetical protein